MTNVVTAIDKKNPSSVARMAHPNSKNKAQPLQMTRTTDYNEVIKYWKLATNIIDRIKRNDPDKWLKVIITPEMAMDILTLNDTGQNRQVDNWRVNSYVAQMENLKWKANNGDTICISKTMKLLDGQHRLWAIYLSGISVEYAIVTGLDEDVFSFKDIGLNRNAEAITSINGYQTNGKMLAQTVKLILLFKKKSIVKGTITDKDVYNYEVNDFEQNKPVMNRLLRDIEMIKLKWDKETNKWFTISQWAFIYYTLRTLPGIVTSTEDKAKEFLDSLTSGIELKPKSPIKVLNALFVTEFKHMLKGSGAKNRSNKASLTTKIKAVFEAWNQHIRGAKIEQLSIDLHDAIISKPIHRAD